MCLASPSWLWTDRPTSPSYSTSARPSGYSPPNPQTHTRSRSTHFSPIFSSFSTPISPINTKILLPSLVHCQVKGLRCPSFPSLFSTLKLSSLLFYSSEEAGDPSAAEAVQPDPNSYRFFKTVDQSLVHRISREFDILGQPDTEGTWDYSKPTDVYRCPTLRTLCTRWSPHQGDMLYVQPTLVSPNTPLTNLDINRLVHPAQSIGSPEDSANLPDPRILILSVSPDASNSYIPIMNSIFSAQKLVSTTYFYSSHPQLSPRKSR